MKRMIVRRGNKIFPSTVENIIMKHPNVKNCAVVQMEHREERHVPAAFLILKNSDIDDMAAEIDELVSKKLPEHNIPYKYIVKDKLPLTGINKIDYRALECETKAFATSEERVVI